jgi:adenine-specific DNA-methyltransferase
MSVSYRERPDSSTRKSFSSSGFFADDVNMNYLQQQLIAYIGNKRRLLPFLGKVFSGIASEENPSFFDPFAGAGAVSRLAKQLGFRVHTNDWEFYSHVINSAYVLVDESDTKKMFRDLGGLDAALQELQRIGERGDIQPYIAAHYAPRRTATADYRRERLFYTRENALFIDAVRSQIEQWYPEDSIDAVQKQEKYVLIASLLYEAATHVNTSGVFKAFHKGFGGHGGDALSRIMAPMRLERPFLLDRQKTAGKHIASCMDAQKAAAGNSYDLVYLDPPYNGHQYGSNYFMLNTIARWDCPEVDNSYGADGKLKFKAGIRSDWVETRSPYCSRSTAADAMEKLLDSMDSRYFIMSYNTDGIVSFEQQMEMFSRRGRVSYAATEYPSYRGGRQSMSRQTATTEYILCVDTKASMRRVDYEKIYAQQRIQYLRSFQSQRFMPGRISDLLTRKNESHTVFLAELAGGFLPVHWEVDQERITLEQVAELISLLEAAVCSSQQEQCSAAMDVLESGLLCGSQRSAVEKEAVRALKRFAHRKYEQEYQAAVERAKALVSRNPDLRFLKREISSIQEIVALRFAG